MNQFVRFTAATLTFFASTFVPAIRCDGAASADPAAVTEPAVTADLNHSDREAIVLREENGRGLIGFLPAVGGGWRLNLYPNPNDVATFAAADFDGDGNTDLLIIRRNGDFATWLGDGLGNNHPKGLSLGNLRDFKPVAARPANLNGDAWTDLTVLDDRGRRLDLINDGFGNLALQTTGRSAPETAGMPAADFMGDGRQEAVEVRGDRLLIHGADGRPVELVSPYRIRAVAIGAFTGTGRSDLAAIGFGDRPALTLFANHSAADTLSFIRILPEIVSTTHTINACYPSFCSVDNGTPNISINTGDTVTWNVVGHTATQTNGPGSCTTLAGGFDNAGASPYSRVFSSAGSIYYKCNVLTTVHCNAGMKGTITVSAAAAVPGTIPDTVTPFKVNKSSTAGSLDLTWGASCSASATASVIYEGTIGTWYSHTPMASAGCATAGTTATVIPAGGSQYYLVVPRTATNEGSYGKDSSGAQIPAGTAPCLPQNLVGNC